jgi:hypothetical protein
MSAYTDSAEEATIAPGNELLHATGRSSPETGAGGGAADALIALIGAPESTVVPAVVSSSSGADAVTGESAAPVAAHNPDVPSGQRCACGCVPNILSLFEMAALRAKRRAELKAAKEAKEAQEAQEAQQAAEAL